MSRVITHLKSKILYIFLALVFFLIDQFSKKIIESTFILYESKTVINHFFSIIYVHNKGFIFGIFSQSGNTYSTIGISLLSVASLLFITLFFLISRNESKLFAVGFSFVIGGAFGNMLDRVKTGYVIDFLDIYVGTYHWPTFNMADFFICVGVGLLILDIWKTGSAKTIP